MTNASTDPLMSVQEMADYLSVSKSSAYKLIKDLQLQVVFPTSDIRIRKSTVDSALLRSDSSDKRISYQGV
jgi:excisionase family DNA binding protein